MQNKKNQKSKSIISVLLICALALSLCTAFSAACYADEADKSCDIGNEPAIEPDFDLYYEYDEPYIPAVNPCLPAIDKPICEPGEPDDACPLPNEPDDPICEVLPNEPCEPIDEPCPNDTDYNEPVPSELCVPVDEPCPNEPEFGCPNKPDDPAEGDCDTNGNEPMDGNQNDWNGCEPNDELLPEGNGIGFATPDFGCELEAPRGYELDGRMVDRQYYLALKLWAHRVGEVPAFADPAQNPDGLGVLMVVRCRDFYDFMLEMPAPSCYGDLVLRTSDYLVFYQHPQALFSTDGAEIALELKAMEAVFKAVHESLVAVKW